MTSDPADQWYSERDISTTLVKGIKVLSAFDDAHARLTLPEIGRVTGYDRATVRRLIITLIDLGFVVKTDKYFSLTPKILSLSGNYLRSHGVGASVQPVLNRYSQGIGKEISLAVLSDGFAIYLARSNMTGSDVSFGFTVGSRLPLLHTALGRMLLATLQTEAMQALIETGSVIQYTADSLMDRRAIEADIKTAGDQGFALVSNEFEPGVAGLAVPVGHLGKAKAVIGISAPVATLQDPQMYDDCLSALQLCANELDRVWVEGP
jgi:IclR family pca regulon transcriptional regulator